MGYGWLGQQAVDKSDQWDSVYKHTHTHTELVPTACTQTQQHTVGNYTSLVHKQIFRNSAAEHNPLSLGSKLRVHTLGHPRSLVQGALYGSTTLQTHHCTSQQQQSPAKTSMPAAANKPCLLDTSLSIAKRPVFQEHVERHGKWLDVSAAALHQEEALREWLESTIKVGINATQSPKHFDYRMEQLLHYRMLSGETMTFP